MDKGLDAAVRQRANHRCEYCHLPQHIQRLKFQIDHIIAEQHNGPTELSNSALCCGRCNRDKGPNLSGIDSETGRMCRLFHPRDDVWNDHFHWRAFLFGRTDVGRVTVAVLAINLPDDVTKRQEMLNVGVILD